MPHVTFRVPGLHEMALKQRWMSDPELMSYNTGWDVDYAGYHRDTGCIDFPEEEWAAWYGRYTGSPDREYFFVDDARGEVVGHAHYRVEDGVAHIGFMTVPARRGEGLGGATLRTLVARIWGRGDVDRIENSFEPTRVAAERAHAAVGFRRVGDLTLVLERPGGA